MLGQTNLEYRAVLLGRILDALSDADALPSNNVAYGPRNPAPKSDHS
jgi:hypothetical protein